MPNETLAPVDPNALATVNGGIDDPTYYENRWTNVGQRWGGLVGHPLLGRVVGNVLGQAADLGQDLFTPTR